MQRPPTVADGRRSADSFCDVVLGGFDGSDGAVAEDQMAEERTRKGATSTVCGSSGDMLSE